MPGRKLQFAIASLTACSALVGITSDCKAQCNCLGRPAFAAPAAPIVSYRPVFAAAPVVAPQTVNYMPYTAYRTVYTNMPVTTYQPAAACGPCGTPTTAMRPVMTYALRPQLVPYTTYRPVVTSVVAAYAPVVPIAPACSPCGGAVGVPLVTSQMATSAVSPFAPAGAGPCSTCAGGAPAATYVTPGAPGYAGPPGYAGAPVGQGMPGNAVPSLGLPNINAPPSLNSPPGQPLAPIPQQPNTTFFPPAGSVIMGPPTVTYSPPLSSSSAPPTTNSAPPSAGYLAPQQSSSPPVTPPAGSSGATFSNQPAAGAANGSTTQGGGGNGASNNSSNIIVPESRLRPRVIPDVAPPPKDFTPGAAPGASGPDGIGNPADSQNDGVPKSNDGGVNGQKTNLQQPRLMDPQDRVTARPIRQSVAYRPISDDPVMYAGATQPALPDDGGWRAGK